MYNGMYNNNFFPYQNMNMPIPNQTAKKGLLGGILGLSKINWGNLLNNTQKTLNVINQAIPVYYQVKPIYNNAKTMFRVFGAMNDKNTSTNNNTPANNNIINTVKIPKTNTKLSDNSQKNISPNQPIFFT